ncbi:phosphonate ABC transporter ATP-binding protein [Aureibacillus halotolerans]|uniref:Phosphonate transport system ATP-binding protein n=1 Tax=Aureibacillus halotolerans TaxID=1508390 RepID=A0A4R6TRL9_9BACI|nr:phosphonate ABC transporter ATP-binding protein [Aureibacillus halotolerans]TDQ36220.1 phosphonate transport system ATP-binding protein [Aureibacillus halotolerans]
MSKTIDMLQIRDVSKIFPSGTTALTSVTADIAQGEAVILLGHNGSGKSTLLRSIGRLETVTSGDIFIEGQSVQRANAKDLRKIRKRMGFVFQKFNLIPTLSVFQNVLFGALGQHPFIVSTFHPFANSSLRAQAMNCLDRVGLGHLAASRADQLSGGQQQRVAIARMLMQDPFIVLADEPIASLDPKAGIEVMELLVDVAREKNITLICTLHQLDLALSYGTRFIGLKQGELVLDEIKNKQSVHSFKWLYEEKKKVVVSHV